MTDYAEDLRKKYGVLHNYKVQAIIGAHFTTDYVEWLEAYAFVLQRELNMLISKVKDEHQKQDKKAVERLDAGYLDLKDTRTDLSKPGGK